MEVFDSCKSRAGRRSLISGATNGATTGWSPTTGTGSGMTDTRRPVGDVGDCGGWEILIGDPGRENWPNLLGARSAAGVLARVV